MLRRLICVFGLLGLTCVSGCATLDKIAEWRVELEEKAAEVQSETPSLSPDVTTQPEQADTDVWSALRWTRGGIDASGALRDEAVTIRDVRVQGHTLYYAGSGLASWPATEGNITHIVCVFFDGDGDGVYERGGKFDWGRSNAAPRPMHHLEEYGGWDGYPASGTPWAAVIVDKDKSMRSNIATGLWP